MGRSLEPVTPALLKTFPLPASLYNSTLDRHFDVYARDGKLFQSEYQTSAEGHEIFRATHEVGWIIGAGANGYDGLVRRGDFLFESPLAFYSRTGKWDFSPGYQEMDIGFARPVLDGCISCHSGRPRPADQNTGKFEAVPFEQGAVGCENCHGPGEAHVHAETTHATGRGSLIVNPNRLSASLENEICMGCHEGGDSRVPMPGKDFKDIRPGVPLASTVAVLMVPPRPDNPSDTEHVQHFFQMSMSKCYRATAGQLRCASCHDPHIEPTGADAPAYFNNKCAACHTAAACKGSAEARRQTSPTDNCIACHMPKRGQTDTPHTSLTNHRIVARLDEPWPDKTFQLTTAALPDLVYENRLAEEAEDLPATVLLEGYRQIAEHRPEYRERYLQVLAKLETTDAEDATVQQALGRRDFENRDMDSAIRHLERAAALDPKAARTFGYLSQALNERGRLDEAIAAGEKAVSLDPYHSLYQKQVIDELVAARQYDKALAAMEHYMELFPEDTEMRHALEFVKK